VLHPSAVRYRVYISVCRVGISIIMPDYDLGASCAVNLVVLCSASSDHNMWTTLQAEEAAAEATRKAREAIQGPDALAFEEKLRKLGFAMQRLQPRDRVADAIQDLEDECAP